MSLDHRRSQIEFSRTDNSDEQRRARSAQPPPLGDSGTSPRFCRGLRPRDSWSMGKHRLQLLAAVLVLACGAAPSTPSALPRSCFVPPQRAGGGGAEWRNCRHGEEAGGSGSMAANRGERDARGMRCRVLQLRGGGSDSDKGETCYGRWVNVSRNGKRKREK